MTECLIYIYRPETVVRFAGPSVKGITFVGQSGQLQATTARPYFARLERILLTIVYEPMGVSFRRGTVVLCLMLRPWYNYTFLRAITPKPLYCSGVTRILR